MKAWVTRVVAAVAMTVFLSSFAGATVIGTDDFESYGAQNPAADPLVGPLTWNYIDGQGDGIAANDHRTFFSGGNGSAMQSTGWITSEDGGGIDTSVSLSSLAGTAFDAGGGNIVSDAAFQISFVISAETSGSNSIDFLYDITSSQGVLTFQSGSNVDQSTIFSSLNDGGTTAGGSRGKSDDRRFSVNFTGNGLALADTIDFSITRTTGAAFMFFDDFVLDALDGVVEDPGLTIDRSTGNVALTNATINNVDSIIGYSILSTAGSFTQTGWDKQATGSQLVNDNDDWTVLTGAGVSTDLSEAVLSTNGDGDGGDLASLGGTLDFGNVWTKSPFEDVQLELLLDDGTVLSTAAGDITTEYTGDEIAVGDITGAGGTPDGDINILDWLEFRGNVGTDVSSLSLAQAYREGDLNGDLVIGPTDYTLFVAAYDEANGAGSFGDMMAGVPEPSSILLMLSGIGAAVCLVGRRRFLGDSTVGTIERGISKMGTRLTAVLLAAFLNFSNANAADFVIAAYDADAGNPATAGDIQNPEDQGFLEWGTTFQGQVYDPGEVVQEGVIAAGINTWRNFDNGDNNPGYGVTLSSDHFQAMFDFGWRYQFTGSLAAGGHFSAWGAPANNPWQAARGRYGGSFGISGSDWTVSPVGTGGSAETIGTPSSDFAHFVLTGDVQAATSTFEVFEFTDSGGTGAQIGTTQNLSGFAGSNATSDSRFGIQSGSSPGTGRDLLIHAASLVVPEPDTLTLEVGTNSGAMALVNNSGASVSFNGYFITSESGSLDPDEWFSLEDRDVDGNGIPDDGIGWEEFDATSSNFIGEGFLTGVTTLNDGEALALGTAFDTSVFGVGNDGDLSFVLTDDLGRQVKSSLFMTVEYIVGFLEADFNEDGSVNGDDFLLWQGGFGIPSGATKMDGDADNDEDVDGDDFLIWQAQFGSGNGSGATAVPEPTTGLLLLVGMAAVGIGSLRRSGSNRRWLAAAAPVLACFVLASTLQAATDERFYSLGEDSFEGAVLGQEVGSGHTFGDATFDSAGDGGGDFQDLEATGINLPVYVDVTDRPGTLAGALGIGFDPAQEHRLVTPASMNAPTQMLDNPDWDGDADTFPHNYTGIFGHGMQLWAKPNAATSGVRQDVIFDTPENAIVITENDTWGLWFDVAGGPPVDSGVDVIASGSGQNGWTHLMEVGGIRDMTGGGSAFDGVLLVNGIAVAARGGAYDPNATELSIGSGQNNLIDPIENYFHGNLDDIHIFLWGDNSDAPVGPNGQVGQDWGVLDYNVDNEWVALELASMGVTDAADVNLDGSVNIQDQTDFLPHWRKVQLVDDVQVGDWNSRQNGDLNYDGIVNLADAFILHEGLLANGGAGFDFGLLGTPEPSTCSLVLVGLMTLLGCRGKLRK